MKEPSNEVSSKRIYRSETNRIIAGICGGLGEYLDIDPVIIRIILVLITIFGGSGVILYIIAWIVIPTKSDLAKDKDYVDRNFQELKTKAKKMAGGNPKFLAGIILLVLGLGFLLGNFGVWEFFNLERFWPVILIVIGLIMLANKE
jgi:phage shock protein C